MTGMPNAPSNRRSAEGGSGAEADRTKRTRAGGRAAGGSAARIVMMAGTALIQVISCSSIHRPESAAAEPAVQHQAGPRGQGRQQPHHLGVDMEQREAAVAAVGRRQPVVDGHARGDVAQLTVAEQDALGRAGGPARAQEDPPAGGGADEGGAAGLPGGASTGRPVARSSSPTTARPGHVEHPGQRRGGRGRIERDDDPAGAEDGDQGGGVSERVRQPDGHARRRAVSRRGPGTAPRPGWSAAGRRRSAGPRPRHLRGRGRLPSEPPPRRSSA